MMNGCMRQEDVRNLHERAMPYSLPLCNYTVAIWIASLILGALPFNWVLHSAHGGDKREESRDVKDEIHFKDTKRLMSEMSR